MQTLEAFQAKLSPNQLDILSAVEAGAVVGGTYCPKPKKSDKSGKSGKSGKSNKNKCEPKPRYCYW